MIQTKEAVAGECNALALMMNGVPDDYELIADSFLAGATYALAWLVGIADKPASAVVSPLYPLPA